MGAGWLNELGRWI